MGTGKLSRKSRKLILALFEEDKILRKVTENIAGKGDYRKVLIDLETGTIYFGKYSWSGFGKFWNRLIKCYDKISFNDFAIRTWDALSDMTVGSAAHTAVVEGLSREVLMTAVRNKDYDWIIDRFFDINRHLVDEGFWKTQGKAADPINNGTYRTRVNGDDNLVVTVAERHPSVGVKVVDAIGDVFEVLNVRWLGSHKSVM